MIQRVNKFGFEVDKVLLDFINKEVLIGLEIEEEAFWSNFAGFINKFYDKNFALLNKRLQLKEKIDSWHLSNKAKDIKLNEYKKFLLDIGYLIPEGESFSIETGGVDDEISSICGPQLVVPITNARYALNAANARWGSLYDALYGTDVMGTKDNSKGYNENRGKEVISYAKNYLDKVFSLKNATWKDIIKIYLEGDKIIFKNIDGNIISIKNEEQYYGYRIKNDEVSEVILEKNNLKIRLIIDKNDRIGQNDPANIADILFESAISTIMDCEDSVATVDAEDKVLAYKNWLGLMTGNLTTTFIKNNSTLERKLNENINIINIKGEKEYLKSRSLMLIRNVGHLMTNPAILDKEGKEVPEGLMDAIFTSLIAMYDIKKESGLKNSESKSIYIVKPKMHGPDEVAFSNDVFTEVEKILNLPTYTIKLGIMDE